MKKLPATVFLETKGGRTLVLAESMEVARKLADDGELVLTPEGVQALADIQAIFPGSKVIKVVSLAKVKYSN